ncbi:MAG: hypothetical protein LIO90_08340 [Bacteroidales bacterium]|nr:hypothetical protein [Bacteroidales bacterium]
MIKPVYLGNQELLSRELVGFFASRHVAPGSVLPTLDWAREVAPREDVAIVSGFQSAMEREVLEVALRRGLCGVIVVLNRSIYRQPPAQWAAAFAAGRVLFISLQGATVRMPSKENAQRRNAFIASLATSLVFCSVGPTSSLYPLLAHWRPLKPTQML